MRAAVVRGIWILLSLSLTASVACSSDDGDGKTPGDGGSGWNTGGSGGSGGSGGDDGFGGAGGKGGAPEVNCETPADCPAEEPVCESGICKALCTSHKECKNADLPQCGESGCEPCVNGEACADKAGLTQCNVDSGSCVECLESEHCAFSASRPYCMNVKCVECTEGDHCPSGVCLPNGNCGPNPPCSKAAPSCEGDRVCNEERGECLPICNPELADQCQPGWGCEWMGNLEDQAKTPYGACVPLQDGAGEQGDSCVSTECQPNLACLDTLEGFLCTGFCNTNTKDCPADFECISASTNSGNSIHVCSPIERPCEMNSDCESDRACTPAPFDGRLLCLPKAGTVQAGGSCSADGDCQSDLCLNDGTCYGPCRNDADCGLKGLCSTLTITYGRDSNNQPVVGKAPVCNIACVTDDDCLPELPSRACGPAEAWGGELAGGCVMRRQGTSSPGATCNTDSECSTGLCQGAPNGQAGRPDGQCFGTCGVSADCAEGAACVERAFDDIDGGIHLCSGPLCKSEGDCGVFREYSCRYGYEWVNDERVVRNRCLPPVGTAGALTSCTTGSQCRSGTCVNWGGAAGLSCYEACDTAADCDVGTCQSFSINITQGGVIIDTIALKGCRP